MNGIPNKKCILLSRVSTHSQDLKQQTDELIAAAHKDGYSDDNIIIIEDKESAIKLSEEERNGLNELKRLINEDELIDCVYVYEVSRIARREQILFSIRDFLVEKHVQLVVLTPYMKLLDKDYKMTQSSQIMFAVFGAISESEMHVKQQRMMRGKRAKSENGYYVGGKVLFGYKVQEDKKFIVDEQQANVVRKMFNMYLEEESISSIATELCSTGEMDKLDWRTVYRNVYRLLNRPEYYGGNSGTINNYPPIISKELFNRVQELLHTHSHPHSKLKNIYYSHKLLRCRKDRRCFIPTISNCCYKYDGGVSIKDKQNHLRVISWNININLIDSILWHYAKLYRKSHSASDILKLRKEIEDKKIKLKRKIEKGKRDIAGFNERIHKANERIVMGKMSEKQGDELIERCKDEIEKLEENILHWETTIFNLICESQILDMDVYQQSVDGVTDEKERYDIIHQCIKVVWVDKVCRGRYKFEIVFIDESSVCFETIPNNSNRVLLDNGRWEYFKRYERFRSKWN